MLSRVADSIFWMARYIERVENLARFIDVTQQFILDQPISTESPWRPLVQVTGDEKWFEEHYDGYQSTNVIRFLTFDRDYPHSIISALTAARENARGIREIISSEVWEQLNDLYHQVKHVEGTWHMNGLDEDLFQTIRSQCYGFHGLLDSTMSHGVGWHFANLGRLLERADKTSRLLDVKYFTLLPNAHDIGTTLDDLQWSAVLKSVSGLEMYRKQFQLISLPRVIQFLVLDETFPRSIRYCLEEAESSLRAISNGGRRRRDNEVRNPPEQALADLNRQLAAMDPQQLIRDGLHEFVDRLQSQLNDLGSRLYEQFIAMRSLEDLPSDSQATTLSPSFQSQSQS